MKTPWPVRLAREEDIPDLELLIPRSVRALHAPYYSAAQREAALGPVFAVDRQLIRDGTYFAVEEAGVLIGCGGWSRRHAMYGGDRERSGEDAFIDPARDPARIRAFFVDPAHARRGIGQSILVACEAAIVAAGFHHAELIATLAGEPLYAASRYTAIERFDAPLTDDLTLPVVRMTKTLSPARFHP